MYPQLSTKIFEAKIISVAFLVILANRKLLQLFLLTCIIIDIIENTCLDNSKAICIPNRHLFNF